MSVVSIPPSVMNKPPSSWGSLSRYRIGETLADAFYEIHPSDSRYSTSACATVRK
jgi:hypothetical protein